MKKETALTIFFQKMEQMQYFIGNDLLIAYEQAKAMEKEQIIDAYDSGQQIPPFIYSEKYYNKTFGGDE